MNDAGDACHSMTKYPNTQVPKYPNTQVPKYPNTQIPKYPKKPESPKPEKRRNMRLGRAIRHSDFGFHSIFSLRASRYAPTRGYFVIRHLWRVPTGCCLSQTALTKRHSTLVCCDASRQDVRRFLPSTLDTRHPTLAWPKRVVAWLLPVGRCSCAVFAAGEAAENRELRPFGQFSRHNCLLTASRDGAGAPSYVASRARTFSDGV